MPTASRPPCGVARYPGSSHDDARLPAELASGKLWAHQLARATPASQQLASGMRRSPPSSSLAAQKPQAKHGACTPMPRGCHS